MVTSMLNFFINGITSHAQFFHKWYYESSKDYTLIWRFHIAFQAILGSTRRGNFQHWRKGVTGVLIVMYIPPVEIELKDLILRNKKVYVRK